MTARLTVWPPAPRRAYGGRTHEVDTFPLGGPDCALFSRARHALWAGVRHLGLRPGDVVLVPAYNHGSELEALIRAGLICRFYGAGPGLAPDEAELAALIDPSARALLLVHYLGFPQDAARWRRWCDEHALLLLEDAAQAWLAASEQQAVGSSGHLSIFCLYKAVGVPDGAALHAEGAAALAPARAKPSPTRLVRHRVSSMIESSVELTRSYARLSHPGGYVPLQDFALGDPTVPPSPVTSFVLSRLAFSEIAERRRAHYRWLLERLGELVPSPFDDLPAGASPMAFPIEVDPEHKEGMLDRLSGHGVVPLDLWAATHPSLPVERFPETTHRRLCTIALPVHQELRASDLDRIATAVRG